MNTHETGDKKFNLDGDYKVYWGFPYKDYRIISITVPNEKVIDATIKALSYVGYEMDIKDTDNLSKKGEFDNCDHSVRLLRSFEDGISLVSFIPKGTNVKGKYVQGKYIKSKSELIEDWATLYVNSLNNPKSE